MIPNHSPWINQLKRTRPVVPLNQNVQADIAIVGGGIAGVTTAFFILRNTNKTVVLLEADKIAHGATGHNAGQITSYFERPLFELVNEFGLQRAIEGQQSVESGWILLDQIISEAKLQTPLYRFAGYTGLTDIEQVITYLKNSRCRTEGGLSADVLALAQEWDCIQDVPSEYKDLYTLIPHHDILALLETNNSSYIAAHASQKGCMNSALFSEELIGYLITHYKDRFTFFEETPVTTVRLGQDTVKLEALIHTINADRAVLCTNGFEYFTIINDAGGPIDTKFHHSVAGRIGYMSGYIEPLNHPPVTINYLPKGKNPNSDPTGESYFYLTRRPHEHANSTSYNLVCAGGPEKVLPNGAEYSRKDSCSEDMRILIDDFLHSNYNKYPSEETEYAFCWHGLMGYTPSGVRLIGPEPCNPVLLYNLGCNGIGILPSIFGGMRISQFLNGEKIERSIFDPKDQRCELPSTL